MARLKLKIELVHTGSDAPTKTAKDLSRQLRITALTVILTLGMLIGLTAAWFATNKKVDVSAMQVEIETNPNLIIAEVAPYTPTGIVSVNSTESITSADANSVSFSSNTVTMLRPAAHVFYNNADVEWNSANVQLLWPHNTGEAYEDIVTTTPTYTGLKYSYNPSMISSSTGLETEVYDYIPATGTAVANTTYYDASHEIVTGLTVGDDVSEYYTRALRPVLFPPVPRSDTNGSEYYRDYQVQIAALSAELPASTLDVTMDVKKLTPVYTSATGTAVAGTTYYDASHNAVTVAVGANVSEFYTRSYELDTLDPTLSDYHYAASIDVFKGTPEQANYVGTLNMAGKDAATSTAGVQYQKVSIPLTGNKIPQNTSDCITVTLRFYFDGALLKQANQTYVRSNDLDLAKLKLCIHFEATEPSA